MGNVYSVDSRHCEVVLPIMSTVWQCKLEILWNDIAYHGHSKQGTAYHGHNKLW